MQPLLERGARCARVAVGARSPLELAIDLVSDALKDSALPDAELEAASTICDYADQQRKPWQPLSCATVANLPGIILR